MKEAEGYSSVVALAEEHFEEGLDKPARLSFSCSLDLLLMIGCPSQHSKAGKMLVRRVNISTLLYPSLCWNELRQKANDIYKDRLDGQSTKLK